MKQHPIDLLPQDIRLRSQSRLRTGQSIFAFVIVIIVLVVLSTHSKFGRDRAEAELDVALKKAAQVLELEGEIERLRSELDSDRAYLELYERVSLPLDVSLVIATVVNQLPSGVSLDRIDLDAGPKRTTRSPRSRGGDDSDGQAPRVLTGEIAGFAANDVQVAELVDRLSATPPFERVSLDFSRTRSVRERAAREFRLSFRIDLDRPYLVNIRDNSGNIEDLSTPAELQPAPGVNTAAHGGGDDVQ